MSSPSAKRSHRYLDNNSWKNRAMKIHPEDFRISSYSEIEAFGGTDEIDNNDSHEEYESMIEENISSYLHSNPSSVHIHQIASKKPIQSAGSSVIKSSDFHPHSKNNSELVEYDSNEPKRTYYEERIPSFNDIPQEAPKNRNRPKQSLLIDRSTCSQKAKPNKGRPTVVIKDDDSDIYDGTDTFNDDEFIEEVYESVDTSNISSKVIVEANSELEYSKELNKDKSFEKYRKESYNYIPNEVEEDHDQDQSFMRLSRSYEDYKVSDRSRKEESKYEDSSPKINLKDYKDNRESIEKIKDTQSTHDNYPSYDYRVTKIQDNLEKVDYHNGDEDTYSQRPSERKIELRDLGKVTSFEKFFNTHIKSTEKKETLVDRFRNGKAMKKSWKSSCKPESPKVELDNEQINLILSSISIHSDDKEKFLKSFCHKYSNLNSSVKGGFSERMKADIEKRENKSKELQKAEELYRLLNERPLDKEQKDECHSRLYLDAFYRAYKLNDKILKAEKEENEKFRKQNRTASKKRIEQFVEKVNSQILGSKEILDKKRRIKELQEEVELQEVLNKNISRGKMSKSRERMLAKKMYNYEEKKFIKRAGRVKEKQHNEEIKIKQYFQPKVSKSSAKLAKKKREHEKSISKIDPKTSLMDSNDDIPFTESIFDRLYKEAETKKEHLNRLRRSREDAMYSASKSNGTSMLNAYKRSSRSKNKSNKDPSFNMITKESPLTSIDQFNPSSPRIEAEGNRLMMQKYLTESERVQENNKNSKNIKKYKSNGAASPCDFITWNESKYNSQSIDQFFDQRIKDAERQNKLMKPLGKKPQKSTAKSISNMGVYRRTRHQRNHKSDHYSITSDTLYSMEDHAETVNYRQQTANSRSKSKKSRDTRKTARKNILAYSLLDRSIDNTISLLEKSKKNNLNELDLSESSGLQTKPKYKFQLKNREREMYLESFRKMQELKVTNEENCQ
ncbi:unnamed protein product [Moneuplotes crassus]|uniref:Uncharacterized protein n=1 Tax=Euplotes crassus TaxID=5936 RepID=A0AAD1XXN3_EUPCR|nr:unnamed protein product [Moneuplotes crassus]